MPSRQPITEWSVSGNGASMSGTVVAAQLGARAHYAIPRILSAAGLLEHLYTDVCATKGWPRILNIIPKGVQPAALRRLTGRLPWSVPPERLTSFSAFGLHYALRRYVARTPTEQTATDLWAGRHFSELVVRYGFGNARGLIAFNGAGLEQLRAARRAGLWTMVEQTIAPRTVLDRLLTEEHEAFPAWAAPPADDLYASEFAEREREEWEAADVVLCGSEFVREGIAKTGGPVSRCVVVPYGVDARFSVPSRRPHDGPLRVLTVGEVGLRKGSPYVLAAALRLAGRAVFRMVGPWGVQSAALAALGASIELTGPVPRANMGPQLAWADVFLLPSICEGSAIAVYEALAAGLPVVCTSHTGSVIRDGVEGFVVAVRDVEAIASWLEILATDKDLRMEMSDKARERASDFTLDGYARRLLAVLPEGDPTSARTLEMPDLVPNVA
jgi:glycosyltransferase involved in cell wall biosynthesis